MGRTTPSNAVTIATSRKIGKSFVRRILFLAAHTQSGIPEPQSWKPSWVQHRHHASSNHGQLLRAASKQLHLHAAEAADPPLLLSPTATGGRPRAGSGEHWRQLKKQMNTGDILFLTYSDEHWRQLRKQMIYIFP